MRGKKGGVLLWGGALGGVGLSLFFEVVLFVFVADDIVDAVVDDGVSGAYDDGVVAGIGSKVDVGVGGVEVFEVVAADVAAG